MTKEAKKFDYVVQRDQWDSEGSRIPKGAVVSMTAEDAQDMVENGTLVRKK